MQKEYNLESLKFPIGKFKKPNFISENEIKPWIKVIENFPDKIIKITNNLSIIELNWKYRPQGWTIKQVVHHCADSHMNSFIRFKLTLTEENPIIKPYEEAKWAELSDGNSDTIHSSIQIIVGVHSRWTLLLKSLSEKDLQKKFIHPENNKMYSLEEVIGIYAWHCEHHLAHIEQAITNKGEFLENNYI